MSRHPRRIFLVCICLASTLGGAGILFPAAVAGTVLFADDFSQYQADGSPSSELWDPPTQQSDPERRIEVTGSGVAERFGGEAGKAMRIYKNEQTIATASTAVTAANRFLRGARVVTVAFDFWDNPEVGAGAATLRVGTGSVGNASRVHEVQFAKGRLSGMDGAYLPGRSARVEIVLNNSTETVAYTDGQSGLAPDRYDVWIDGRLVLAGHAWNRGELPIGSELTGLQFACFTSNRAEFMVRNLRVYEGAVVEPAEETAPFEVFLHPLGNDQNDGRGPDTPILSIARAQEILALEGPAADVRIRIAAGRYHGQEVVWTYTRPGQRIQFEPLDPAGPMPVFDGCSEAGECLGGTWLRLNFSGGRQTNLEFRHLRFENYQTAISFNGNRNDPNGYNGGNVISGCYFYRIGNLFNPTVAPSTAVVRLVNSKENLIENNDFVDAINLTSGGLLHAVYVAHLSDRNFILQNRFIHHSGDAVRVRDYSNDNVIVDNVFVRAGADGYSEWYCDQDVRDDCTKPTPECPSWGNQFRNNILASSYSGGTLGTFRFHQGDSTTGCSPPDENAVRLRTSGNARWTPGPIDLWRHRFFSPAEREEPEVSGDQAAAAGDRVPNLVKYALGLHPRRAVRSGDLPAMTTGPEGPELVFWRNLSAPDVEIRVEMSPDLRDWAVQEIAPAEGEVVDDRVRVRVPARGPAIERQFFRLSLRRQDP